jgi:hypothetical protein
MAKETDSNPEPKRARSAYSFFVAENRPIVAESNKDLKSTEIFKKVAELWKLSESDEGKRAKFVKMAEKDKDRYAKEEAKWKAAGGVRKKKEKKEKKENKKSKKKE